MANKPRNKNVVGAVSKAKEVITTTAKNVGDEAKRQIREKGPDLAKKGWHYMRPLLEAALKEAGAAIIKTVVTKNHPSWYYSDTFGQPKLAVNPTRPFNSQSLSNITDNGTFALSNTLARLQVEVRDLSKNPALQTAAQEALVDIREELKSNLTYGYDHVYAYFQRAYSLLLRAVAIERTVRSAYITFADVPDFNRMIASVPANTFERDVVQTITTAIGNQYPQSDLTERENQDNYERFAAAMNAYPILVDKMSHVLVPSALGEFVQWLFGHIFIDENVNNPEFYVVDPRVIPMGENRFIDFASDTIHALNADIDEFMRDFAVLQADLMHMTDYTALKMHRDPADNKDLFLYDTEFFVMLDNAYTISADEMARHLYTDGSENPYARFFRIDMPNEFLNSDSNVGSILGLCSLFLDLEDEEGEKTALFKVLSMAVFTQTAPYISGFPGNYNVNIPYDASGEFVYHAIYQAADKFVCFQYDTAEFNDDTVTFGRDTADIANRSLRVDSQPIVNGYANYVPLSQLYPDISSYRLRWVGPTYREGQSLIAGELSFVFPRNGTVGYPAKSVQNRNIMDWNPDRPLITAMNRSGTGAIPGAYVGFNIELRCNNFVTDEDKGTVTYENGRLVLVRYTYSGAVSQSNLVNTEIIAYLKTVTNGRFLAKTAGSGWWAETVYVETPINVEITAENADRYTLGLLFGNGTTWNEWFTPELRDALAGLQLEGTGKMISYQRRPKLMIPAIIESMSHNIPVIDGSLTTIIVNTTDSEGVDVNVDAEIRSYPVLFKERNNSMMYNTLELEALVYQMVHGLLRPNRTHKKRSDYKR